MHVNTFRNLNFYIVLADLLNFFLKRIICSCVPTYFFFRMSDTAHFQQSVVLCSWVLQVPLSQARTLTTTHTQQELKLRMITTKPIARKCTQRRIHVGGSRKYTFMNDKRKKNGEKRGQKRKKNK